jgi:hypothetical protein
MDQQNGRNPKGKYPLCKPTYGHPTCERCGLALRDQQPCPAVDPDDRWGPDHERSIIDEPKWRRTTTSVLKISNGT